MTDSLKPCPFCGEVPDADHPATFATTQGDKWGRVVCCCEGPEVRTGYRRFEHWRAAAIAEWNRRPGEDKLRDAAEAEIKRLRVALGHVAEQALSSEIPDGYGPDISTDPEFHRGYDAAIEYARTALRLPPNEEPDMTSITGA